MTRWIAAAAITVAALVVTTPARAAVDLGVGTSPRLAMEPNGTAHIVFSNDDGAVYCRLPRGARHCDVRVAMPLADSSGPAYIVRRASDGALFVVQTSDPEPEDFTWVRESRDHGLTWSPPRVLGTNNGLLGLADVQLGPDGDSLLTVTSDVGEGVMLQWGPIAGGQSRLFKLTGGIGSDDTRILTLRDGRVLSVSESVNFRLLWRLFRGGDPYNQAAWQPFPAQRLPDGANPQPATGPRGTFVMSTRTADAQLIHGRAAFRVRTLKKSHFTGGRTFGGDVRVGSNNETEALFEDARGRLHAAWTSTGQSRSCLVYARTTAKRRSWFGRSTTLFVTRRLKLEPDDVHLAATANGRGIAVWQDYRFGGKVHHIRVTALRQKRGKARFIRQPSDRPVCPRG
jgi:hypothetical protein